MAVGSANEVLPGEKYTKGDEVPGYKWRDLGAAVDDPTESMGESESDAPAKKEKEKLEPPEGKFNFGKENLKLEITETRIGRGGFGQVNDGYYNDKEVAVKFERINSDAPNSEPKLAKECAVYEDICPNETASVAWPKLHCHGSYKGYYLMVMEKLGNNLLTEQSSIMKDPPEKRSKKVAEIGHKAIRVLEQLHEKGYVHGDVKPENLVYGKNSKDIFLIDLGLATKWKKETCDQHIEYDQRPSTFRGTRHYASVHAHLGRNSSRRDDLESLAYTLLFLFCGRLPWQNKEAKNENAEDKKVADKDQNEDKKDGQKNQDEAEKDGENNRICRIKIITYQKKLPFCPHPFRHYIMKFLEYAMNLKFDVKPNYEACRTLFRCMADGKPDTLSKEIDIVNLENNILGSPSAQWISIYSSHRAMKQRYHYNIPLDDRILARYINKEKEEKLWISSVASCQDSWALIMEERAEFSDQRYTVLQSFDDKEDWIENNRNEGYYITALAGLANGTWLVIMSKGETYSQQIYSSRTHFPHEYLPKLKEGFYITALATAGDKWAIVMSQKTGSSEGTEQVVEVDFCYPAQRIYCRWKDGFTISLTAATDDQVAFVLERPIKKPARETSQVGSITSTPPLVIKEISQEVHLTSAFPRNIIKAGWMDKHYVTSLCYYSAKPDEVFLRKKKKFELN